MTKRKMIDADELLKGLYDERPKDVALYIANFPEASCMNPEKMHDTDDLISRQAAIDAIWHSIGDANGELQSFAEVIVGDAEDEIRALPSAQPERTGKWKPMFNGEFKGGAYWFQCSECGRVVPEVRNGGWNYCPNCGARMTGGDAQ